MADAGWYPDAQDPRVLRYFDGQNWTANTQPAPGVQQAQQYGTQQPPAQQPPTQHPAQQYGTQQLPVQQRAEEPAGTQPPYASSRYGQQEYGNQQQYAQQQYGNQQQQYGQQHGQPAFGPQGAAPAPPAQRRARKKPLLIALAAVVIVAAGLITFFAVSGDDPKFTYNGKPVASAAKVLSSAESKVDADVRSRHGKKSSDSRCYFAQPKKASSGSKKTDVESTLRCGPVLFVDGDSARQYLPVKVAQASSKDGSVTLTTTGSLADTDPVAIGSDVTLARPDGKSAASGNGGLTAPSPQAAASDALLATSLGTTTPPKSLSGAVMASKTTSVSLTAAGEITRYGTGDSARSAPSGKKLIAFRISYAGGDVSSSQSSKATLTIAGASARALPTSLGTDEWIVAAVPSSGSAALTLAADGYTQTLALPTGTPGTGNIAVAVRTHHSAFVFRSFDVPVKVSGKGGSGTATLHGRLNFASLDYWIPGHTDQHASSTKNGILSVDASYTRKGSSQRFGFDPHILRLKLPDGRTVGARNVAGAGHVDDVFEVPSNFTRGTLEVTGSVKESGVTLRVTKSASIGISITAG